MDNAMAWVYNEYVLLIVLCTKYVSKILVLNSIPTRFCSVVIVNTGAPSIGNILAKE